jgi:GR25 family glycosyltransferase involved in LPS biosynthesis
MVTAAARKKHIYIFAFFIGIALVWILRAARFTEGFQTVQTASVAPASQPPPKDPLAFYKKAYVVTLEKESPERYPRVKQFANSAGIPLQPWPGVRITPDQKDTLPPLGIGTTHYSDRRGNGYNWGIIGCFLAHRNLLTHISKSAGPEEYATLVFEDDIVIPSDFHTKLAKVLHELPNDWDILFLDKINMEGSLASSHIMKLSRDLTGKKNWGMWSYFVRTSSIQSRILPILEYMTDNIDLQLNINAHKLNMYIARPSIISLDTGTSTQSVIAQLG